MMITDKDVIKLMWKNLNVMNHPTAAVKNKCEEFYSGITWITLLKVQSESRSWLHFPQNLLE